MSTEELERQTRNLVNDAIPQIQQHSGYFEVGEDDGRVEVTIGGVRSGCSIAPMTMGAIATRLPDHVDGVSDVEVVRAGGSRAAAMPSKIDEMEEMEEYEHHDPPFCPVRTPSRPRSPQEAPVRPVVTPAGRHDDEQTVSGDRLLRPSRGRT